ncbi:NAD(P)H-binding protein [Streptomyces sp. SCUT-3]|uniref:NAD(P)H-binding protein n=1 Tax=Streptomyces TaxID=1883 RepID=UPI0015FA2D93|nr:NAD(P)H-binding protein [Streptomyces sp. SCUT-3]QMV21771.1 NAD(P)H-binding protein [Streptomyces sp. SCUT-3]
MTTHGNNILVLGSTGKTGRRLVRRLRAEGRPVRPASRSGEVPFDWFRPDTWQPALDGASAVYLVAPEDPAPVQGFVEQAEASGVGRFVVLSGRGVEHVGEDFGRGMAAAERAVRRSGAEWTIVRPNNFDQNFDEDLWLPPLRAGRLALPTGGVPEPFVDVEDVAEVAAALLTRDGHAGRVYELSGPRALTFGSAVAVIARASGRRIEHVELTPQEYHAELLADGLTEADARGLGAMFAMMRAGHSAEPADGVQRVLGREPADFASYAARAAAAGAWS